MDDAPLRGCRWPEFDPTKRPPLRLDPRAVEDYRTALDTMTCIVRKPLALPRLWLTLHDPDSQSFISSLILLVRMTSSGLSSCDLACKRSDYEAGAAIGVAQLLQGACKLPRLLELGAAFLFAVAPNRHHPARKHSVLVQMILKAGLGENTPHVSASDGSPGTINLDPSPSSNEPQPAATAAAVNPLPPLPPLPLQQEQRTTNTGSPSTPDSWMWNAATPGLPLSSDGGALLIPSMPEFSATQGSNPMTNILSSGDNPFFSNYCASGNGFERRAES